MNFGKGASRPANVLTFEAIEKRRLALDISIETLCAEARVSPRAYYNARAGQASPRRMTRSKLSKALHRVAVEGDMA